MREDNTENLTQLGSQKTEYNYSDPSVKILETFKNQFSQRIYKVEYVFKEFSSLCPKTDQPDTAIITVEYFPDQLCIETKSLKLYFLAYRNHGAFMETITNQILEDCVQACSPRRMTITSVFAPRGGTYISVEAKFEDLTKSQ